MSGRRWGAQDGCSFQFGLWRFRSTAQGGEHEPAAEIALRAAKAHGRIVRQSVFQRVGAGDGFTARLQRMWSAAGPVERLLRCTLAVHEGRAGGQPPTIYGDGVQSRDFTFVEDVVAELNLKAAREKGVSGRVYNGGNGGVYGPGRAGDVHHSQADTTLAVRESGPCATLYVRGSDADHAGVVPQTGRRQKGNPSAIKRPSTAG